MSAHNLPNYLTPFIGRSQEIAQLVALLADPACRLLTLIGPGGIGKTRLALEAARATAASETDAPFSNGVYFVALQPVNSPDLLLSTIASAVNFQFYSGGEPRQQLLDYLREKNLLLLLDNFEHLLDAVPLVSEILDYATRLKILVTSRERLNLSGESIFIVDGMHVPDREMQDNLLGYSAVSLFVQSARRARPDFHAEGDDLGHLASICRLVGGMPLAILMAAAWVEVLTLKEINAEISRSLDLLETEMRDIPPRQRTMRATFDHSWMHLTEAERSVFQTLSVFRGGFTREAAQAVTGASLKTLASLVSKSLVRVDASGRYDLHELLRQYAEERLSETPAEYALAHDRHCTYFADFMVLREYQTYRGGNENSQAEGLAKIAAEKENVIVALYHAASQNNLSTVRCFFKPLTEFYEISADHQESETVFTNVHLLLSANPQESEDYQRTLAWVMGFRGRHISLQARLNEAKPLLLEGEAILRRFSPGMELADILSYLGSEYYAEDYEQSKQWAKDMVEISTAIDYPVVLAVGYVALSGLGLWQGNYDEAYQNAVRALTIARSVNHRYEESWALWALTSVAIIQKDFAAARRYAEQTVLAARAINYQRGILNAYFNLGDIACVQGEYAESQTFYDQCLSIGRDLGNRFWSAQALNGLGKVALEQGVYQPSWEHFYQALALAQAIDSQLIKLEALTGIAELFARSGYATRAVEISTLILNSSFAFAVNNVTVAPAIRERVNHLKDSLRDEMDSEAFADAEQRGAASDLAASIVYLLQSFEFTLATPKLNSASNQNLLDPLSERELEVLQLMADGLTNSEIAEQFVVGVSTVKKHINHIFSKLAVEDRAQAIVRAQELNLL